MSNQTQITANRQNAQLSTAPSPAEARAKSNLNAVKTGLSGRTVLVSSHDAAAYEEHLRSFEKRYAPANDEERNLVQSLADTEWRLLRIPNLEMGIYAVGRLQLAPNFQEVEDPQARHVLLEAQVYLTYQRQLNNLSVQEGRLSKQRDKIAAELERLQKERGRETFIALQRAADLYSQAKEKNQPLAAGEIGFEFTTAQLEQYLHEKKRGGGLSAAIRAGIIPRAAA